MAFHQVLETQIGERLARVYVLKGNKAFRRTDEQQVKDFLQSVFMANKDVLDHGLKYVLLLWSEQETPMVDWWIWGEKESESEGSMIEVFLFRRTERYMSPFVTAEDGLLVLAEEAK